MRIIVTRPQPDAERTADALRAQGHEVVVAPLLRLETLKEDFGAGPFAAVLITSANGARAAAQHPRADELRALPWFAVGDRSAAAARAEGFAGVTSADGDAGDLADLVAERCRDAKAPLLYLAGSERSGDLSGDLQARGFAVRTAIGYRAVALPFPPLLQQALQQAAVDAVLHFSRRSAELYVRGAAEAGITSPALKPRHYCLSAQVAEPLVAAHVSRVVIADAPNETALLAALGAR